MRSNSINVKADESSRRDFSNSPGSNKYKVKEKVGLKDAAETKGFDGLETSHYVRSPRKAKLRAVSSLPTFDTQYLKRKKPSKKSQRLFSNGCDVNFMDGNVKYNDEGSDIIHDGKRLNKGKTNPINSLASENDLTSLSPDNEFENISLAQDIKTKRTKFPAAVSIVEEIEKVKEIGKHVEKQKELISKILPKDVSKQLQSGNSVKPKEYDNVTIYFSDIVGFTTLVSQLKPMQVIICYYVTIVLFM